MTRRSVAISCGDVNGISAEILLKSHQAIRHICEPLYCMHPELLCAAADRLNLPRSDEMEYAPPETDIPTIEPGAVSAGAGGYSFHSFKSALTLADNNRCESVVTLPTSKNAWQLANVPFKGHTDYLTSRYGKQGIMTLGANAFFVSLFTDHIPLNQVPEMITESALIQFLTDVSTGMDAKKIAVTGLNPHAGENGLLGSEDEIIQRAIHAVNLKIGRTLFYGPVPGDSAFTEHNRRKFSRFVAMYHDQGIIPVKTLYFDRVVNITLNLPVKRVSVGHGTAFDIAYRQAANVSCTGYVEAVKTAVRWCEKGTL